MEETMMVIIDGEECRRRIDRYEMEWGTYRLTPPRPHPVLFKGEIEEQTVDGKVHIIRC